MRILLAFLSAAMTVSAPVYAYTVDEMWAEFDASKLAVEEKRFLQFGLALDGRYSALMDGAWGGRSQRALEAWARSAGLDPPIENWEVVLLALESANRVQADGWEQRYFEPMDISFAIPVGRIRQEPSTDAFLNYAHTTSSLRYSLHIGDLPQVIGIHTYALSSAIPGTAPYTLRREKVMITSVEQAGGTILYARSDLGRSGWSTVVLSAAKIDQSLVNAVSGSISKGWTPGIELPQSGKITEGFTSMAAILAEAERDPPNEYAMRERMVAPPTAPAPQQPAAAPEPPMKSMPNEQELQGSGTAFFVSDQGHLLTNAHVVENCETLKIDGRTVILLATDDSFDLALIRDVPQESGAVAQFAARPAPLNADITVAGYPLAGLLSGLNITRGSVSSLKGMAGDAIRMQISAPVQPGNSGGPAVDAAGRVVGVVVSKLDAKFVADVTGDIPQNVNFAVRGEIAKLFMFQNGVEPVLATDEAPTLDPVTLGRNLEAFTKLVECYAVSG
ncbi:S1 family peptidase [Paracoccus siganidrum]|uniref:Serine protease n=1 Tax=Paracoccus siganidrum TaxID=1276757 RepID=A0A419A7N1_9RHOB|nr:serine protease [Paracoccus siganidrum]RJL17983.1 serine protease [Paracoccus siganidrum]RMC40989.1 serine protease [Paracoccus siganidrum]